jgi:hypothetical protein
MKYVVLALSLINGFWMLTDGIYVLLNGKYIGPEKPGPWASLLSITGVDVFKLGPMFVAFGIAWLVFVFGLFSNSGWAFWYGIVLAFLTLWYLPVGTVISILVFAGLLIFRESVIPSS